MDPSQLSAIWNRVHGTLAFRVSALYAGASWFLVQATATLGASPARVRLLAIAVAGIYLLVLPVLLVLDRRRADSKQLDPATPAVPRRAVSRRWAVAVTVFAVVAAGLWGFGSRVAGGSVPVAAERLAVLPFHATGPAEVRELGVGMVDLLTTALSDVGGIRTVASRSILARAGRGDAAELDLVTSLDIGRQLGAGSVLIGGVVAFGANLRLTAEIYDVADQRVLASAQVDGPQDSVVALTDQLAVGLLRELWRSSAPVPTVRVSALTTRSPSALREYLRGEEHLRSMRTDSAAEAFGRAIAIDSTFALAWLRLADAVGWFGGASEDIETQRGYAARALELAARLPAREQSFVRARNLALNGSFAAFDTLDAYVRRYPDDPLGWYHLADARFHSGYLGRFEPSQIVEPFLEATRLDPAFGAGLFHVLDMAIQTGDRMLFDTAMTRYARVVSDDRVHIRRQQGAIRWAAPDMLLGIFATALRGYRSTDRVAINALIGALGRKTRLDPETDPVVYAQAMDSLVSMFPDDPYWQFRARNLRLGQLGSLGRAQEFIRGIDDFSDLGPMELPPDLRRASNLIGAAINGDVPHSMVTAERLLLEQNVDAAPFITTILHVHSLVSGDVTGADRYPMRIVQPPDTRAVDTVAVRTMFVALADIFRGDTIGGLERFEAGLNQLGYSDAAYIGTPWEIYGEVLTTIPHRRREGIRMLRWRTATVAFATGATYLSLGRALEAEGDVNGARDAYGHVLRYWAGADEYRRADYDEALAALTRLADRDR
jgi:TolB-like protein